MDSSVLIDAGIGTGLIATGTIGSVFLFTWVRDVMAKWARARELEAINHSHAMATLGDIAGAGQAQTAVVADKGTTAVSK